MKPAILATALTIASGAPGVSAVPEPPEQPAAKSPAPTPAPIPDFTPAPPLAPVTHRLLDSAQLPEPVARESGRLAAPISENPPLYDAPSLPYPSQQPRTLEEAEKFMERYRRRTYRSMPVYVIPLSGKER